MSSNADCYVPVRIRAQHYEALHQAAMITGRSHEDLLNEALEQYVECDISVVLENQAACSAKA